MISVISLQEVMKTQHELGIDVITDGEMDRGAYYIHIMNNIKVCATLITWKISLGLDTLKGLILVCH